VGLPFPLSPPLLPPRTPPPLAGEHGDEVLTELGYGPADIERLRLTGVI
jgi:crotonobetainyl-CoA:carnitine CoA-transferase CaiB-like acyl-CoA transferase